MRPNKPYDGFPLTANGNGQWSKKINGRVHYFGVWDDPQAALNLFQEQRDDLYAGRTPGIGDGLTVIKLVNHFLTSKKRKREAGELGERSYQNYYKVCERVLKVLGKTTHVEKLRPSDFGRLRADFAKTHGAVALVGDITCVRVLFKFADDNFKARVNYGQEFDKPSRAVLRKARNDRPAKFLEAAEIKALLATAKPQLKAMIYLGVNCGFGNLECARLPIGAIDFNGGWINFPRPKTGIRRRCALWVETKAAIIDAIAKRPAPISSDDDAVFMTKQKNTWEPKSTSDNPVGKEFTKLLKELKIHRQGVGFYSLRHVFRTIGGKNRDLEAVRAIMGWADDTSDMATVYNEEPVDDERLIATSNYVREWLFT